MKTKLTGAFLAVSFIGTIGWATPSGLKMVPSDVKIPNFNGRALPVILHASQLDSDTIYVQPLEGVFVSQGIVKSPLADCTLVSDELKISQINTESRVILAELLKQIQIELEQQRQRYNKLVQEYERLMALEEGYQGMVTQTQARKQEVVTRLAEIKREIQALNDSLVVAETAEQIAEIKKQIDDKQREEKEAKVEFVRYGKEARAAEDQLMALQIDLKEAEGRKTGIQKTLSSTTTELGEVQSQLSKLQEASELVLKRYSERVGGYTTYTAEFAPADFIQALQRANPKYQFQYVNSVTATVDTTVPENIVPGSPLEAQTGSLILDAKWSDPERARLTKAFRRHLLDADFKDKDPVQLAQTRFAEFESSLAGTKFLSLKLSVLGYCALREPTALSSQFTNGSADTFKLALYYTFPMNFALRMRGRYNAYASLYELHKLTKSSSWFGLSKKQKQEHVRDLSSSKWVDVKVEPIGMELSPQESIDLTKKVEEQLLFYAVEPFLEKGGVQTPPAPDPGPLGASTVGKRLMFIPNPYAFWGGVVLTSLGEMFGSASGESVTRMTESSWVSLNYEAGFTFMIPADITIGDLKRAELKEGLSQ